MRTLIAGGLCGGVMALAVGAYLLLRWLYDRRLPPLLGLWDELHTLRVLVRLHRPAAQARRAMLAEARRHWKLP